MKDLTKKFFIILIISLFLITTVFATNTNGLLTGRFSTIAGQVKVLYDFKAIENIAIDKLNNIYLVDKYTNRVLVLDDEKNIIKEYNNIKINGIDNINYIDFDNNGNIIILDKGNGNIVKVDKQFKYMSSINADINLNNPTSFSIAKDGCIYVTDTDNNRIIKLNPDFTFNKELIGNEENRLFNPTSILVKDDYIYFIDNLNTRIVKLDKELNIIKSFSQNIENEIPSYVSMAIDKNNNIIVADSNMSRIILLNNEIDINKIYVSGVNGVDKFSSPRVIKTNTEGDIYLLNESSLLKLNKNINIDITFDSVTMEEKDKLSNPTDLAVSASENMYVVDKNKNRIVKIDKNGKVVKEKIGLVDVSGITIDSKENIYIVINSANKIIKLNTNLEDIISKDIKDIGTLITKEISGIATDLKGNVYITSKDTPSVIKLNSDLSFDKALTKDAKGNNIFINPTGISVSKNGNIYVIDENKIIKLNKDLTLNSSYNDEDDNRLNSPKGIVVDDFSNIYITDTGNDRIVKLNENLKWIEDYNLYDKEYEIETKLNNPVGISASVKGIYISDTYNNVISFMPYATVDNPEVKE